MAILCPDCEDIQLAYNQQLDIYECAVCNSFYKENELK